MYIETTTWKPSYKNQIKKSSAILWPLYNLKLSFDRNLFILRERSPRID